MPASPTPKSSTLKALAAIGALTALLGACQNRAPATTGSLYPTDYRARHPIALTDAGRSLDVFVTGTGHIDPRQAADIDAFLVDFRRYGRGTLVLDMPRGVAPAMGAAVERTGAAIRRMSAEGGLAPGQLVVTSYAVATPTLVAPLRLSFQRMEAKVAGQCGLWPQDLGVGDAAFNGRNEAHWNFGCSTQSNIAAQVADPIDLVRGRPEGRIDTVRRTKNIEKLRTGNDPSIPWRQDGKADVKSQVAQ